MCCSLLVSGSAPSSSASPWAFCPRWRTMKIRPPKSSFISSPLSSCGSPLNIFWGKSLVSFLCPSRCFFLRFYFLQPFCLSVCMWNSLPVTSISSLFSHFLNPYFCLCICFSVHLSFHILIPLRRCFFLYFFFPRPSRLSVCLLIHAPIQLCRSFFLYFFYLYDCPCIRFPVCYPSVYLHLTTYLATHHFNLRIRRFSFSFQTLDIRLFDFAYKSNHTLGARWPAKVRQCVAC